MPHIIMFLYRNYLPWFFMRMALTLVYALILFSQGDANRSADFYLKETPDGAVCFESFTCPGMYISVSNSTQVQGRHFSISLLVRS